jgi:hypothetical protein
MRAFATIVPFLPLDAPLADITDAAARRYALST